MHVSFHILPVAMNASAVIFNSYSPPVRLDVRPVSPPEPDQLSVWYLGL